MDTPDRSAPRPDALAAPPQVALPRSRSRRLTRRQRFLDPNAGWLNRLVLQPLALTPYPGPFTEAGFNLLQIMLGLWSIGPGMLIMLGAMQGVPRELYEAARVDGAGPAMRFASITLPLISPAILFSLVINLIAVFGRVALLDRGNPFSGSASAFNAYIYDVMFRRFELKWLEALIPAAATVRRIARGPSCFTASCGAFCSYTFFQ